MKAKIGLLIVAVSWLMLSMITIAWADTTTVVTPDGDIIICTDNGDGVIVCL